MATINIAGLCLSWWVFFLYASPSVFIKGSSFSTMGVNDYDFIKYEEDTLLLPKGDSTLLRFFEALDLLKGNQTHQVNLVHFGDSHIQADFFTDVVRARFHSDTVFSFGNAGRGFFFPCDLAKSNTPYNITVAYTGLWEGCSNLKIGQKCGWGLGGYTALTRSSASTFTVSVNQYSLHKYPSTTVRVYYDTQDPSNFKPVIWQEAGAKLLYNEMPGYAEFLLDSPVQKIKISFEKTTPEQNRFVLKGLYMSTDEKGILYHTAGVNGATVNSFLGSTHLESDIESLDADLVLISLGTNDAYLPALNESTFFKQYDSLITRLREKNPGINIILTTPGDCYYQGQANKSNLTAQKVIYELAQKHNCAVWDLFNVMGGLGSVSKWYAKGLAGRDLLHFSREGYRLQGELLYEALIKEYKKYSDFKSSKEKLKPKD